MEDMLDLMGEEKKEYYDLCLDCLNEIDSVNSTITRDSKQDIKIDEHHTYIIGKNGPVIKTR